MISRGRATHYLTPTVKITGRYKAADGLAQPHRKPRRIFRKSIGSHEL
jgi:hypothetical protein